MQIISTLILKIIRVPVLEALRLSYESCDEALGLPYGDVIISIIILYFINSLCFIPALIKSHKLSGEIKNLELDGGSNVNLFVYINAIIIFVGLVLPLTTTPLYRFDNNELSYTVIVALIMYICSLFIKDRHLHKTV